eukprot:4369973-Amphidinium_carterae.2
MRAISGIFSPPGPPPNDSDSLSTCTSTTLQPPPNESLVLFVTYQTSERRCLHKLYGIQNMWSVGGRDQRRKTRAPALHAESPETTNWQHSIGKEAK